MNKEEHAFYAIDTCSLTKCTSYLQYHKVSCCIINTKKEEACIQNIVVDFDSSIHGATYISVYITIKFEQMLQKNFQFTTVIINKRGNNKLECTFQFKKPWPLYRYPYQKQINMESCLS